MKIINANGGGFVTDNSMFNIRWQDIDMNQSSSVYWEFSTNLNAWTRINAIAVAVSDLSMSWYVNTGLSSSLWFRALESNTNRIVARSESSLTVTDKMLILLEPDGGEEYNASITQSISWDFAGLSTLSLYYTHDNGVTWAPIVSGINAASGSYAWTIPDTPSDLCRVKLQDNTYSYMVIESQSNFTILPVVLLPPVIEFSADVTYGEIPLSVQFSSVVDPGVGTIASYNWNFGDGECSNIANPQHTYTIPGIYTVSLSVVNSYNIDDSQTMQDFIEVLPNRPQIEVLSQTSVNFGVVYLGDVSEPRDIILRNSGTAPLVINCLDLYENDSLFSILDNSVPIEIAVGDIAAIRVQFIPEAIGTVSDSLYIHNNSANIPIVVLALRGTGEYVIPKSPEGLQTAMVAYNMHLTWNAVTQTIYNTPIEPDGYLVFINGSSNPIAEYHYLGFTTGLSYTHYQVGRYAKHMFYRVRAVKHYDFLRSSIQSLVPGLPEAEVMKLLRR